MADSGALSNDKKPGASTARLISSFYLEIEHLLERVERADNHYQTLAVDRNATVEQINEAFQQAVVVLQPPDQKVNAALPDELRSRIGEAFAKVSQAYDTLVNSDARATYDGAAVNKRSFVRVQPLDLRWAAKRLNPEQSRQPANASAADSQTSEVAPEVAARRTIDIRVFYEQARAYVKASQEATRKLRRCERFKLSIPALITGYDPDGTKWKEVPKTIDVSRVGIAVRMTRKVRFGTIVHVILPLPTKLRSHGFTEPSYNTYAIVRRVEPPAEGYRVVGLEFIGAHPPADFLKRRGGTFRTQKWAGADRRIEPRQKLNERLEVWYLDEYGEVLGQEIGVTDNVSASGCRLRVKSAPPEFEYVRIKSPRRGFESVSVPRNRYVAKDDIERVCLEFLHTKWPGMPTADEVLAARNAEAAAQAEAHEPRTMI